MRRIVVLGTGTDVGKTYASVALARALAALEPAHAVQALKPIETGITPTEGGGPPADSDAARLEAASHLASPVRPHPFVRLSTPVSPFRSARIESRAIELAAIREWADAATLHYTTCDWQIIETAGGAFSPITADATNVELAATLGAATWLLVAADALGVIHDVTATLEAMAARARRPDLIVLTAARDADASTGGNAAELAALGSSVPIVGLPRGGSAAALAEAVGALRPSA